MRTVIQCPACSACWLHDDIDYCPAVMQDTAPVGGTGLAGKYDHATFADIPFDD